MEFTFLASDNTNMILNVGDPAISKAPKFGVYGANTRKIFLDYDRARWLTNKNNQRRLFLIDNKADSNKEGETRIRKAASDFLWSIFRGTGEMQGEKWFDQGLCCPLTSGMFSPVVFNPKMNNDEVYFKHPNFQLGQGNQMQFLGGWPGTCDLHGGYWGNAYDFLSMWYTVPNDKSHYKWKTWGLGKAQASHNHNGKLFDKGIGFPGAWNQCVGGSLYDSKRLAPMAGCSVAQLKPFDNSTTGKNSVQLPDDGFNMGKRVEYEKQVDSQIEFICFKKTLTLVNGFPILTVIISNSKETYKQEIKIGKHPDWKRIDYDNKYDKFENYIHVTYNTFHSVIIQADKFGDFKPNDKTCPSDGYKIDKLYKNLTNDSFSQYGEQNYVTKDWKYNNAQKSKDGLPLFEDRFLKNAKLYKKGTGVFPDKSSGHNGMRGGYLRHLMCTLDFGRYALGGASYTANVSPKDTFKMFESHSNYDGNLKTLENLQIIMYRIDFTESRNKERQLDCATWTAAIENRDLLYFETDRGLYHGYMFMDSTKGTNFAVSNLDLTNDQPGSISKLYLRDNFEAVVATYKYHFTVHKETMSKLHIGIDINTNNKVLKYNNLVVSQVNDLEYVINMPTKKINNDNYLLPQASLDLINQGFKIKVNITKLMPVISIDNKFVFNLLNVYVNDIQTLLHAFPNNVIDKTNIKKHDKVGLKSILSNYNFDPSLHKDIVEIWMRMKKIKVCTPNKCAKLCTNLKAYFDIQDDTCQDKVDTKTKGLYILQIFIGFVLSLFLVHLVTKLDKKKHTAIRSFLLGCVLCLDIAFAYYMYTNTPELSEKKTT